MVSNTKLAVVFSRSGFRTDSTDVSGGVGPSCTMASPPNETAQRYNPGRYGA